MIKLDEGTVEPTSHGQDDASSTTNTGANVDAQPRPKQRRGFAAMDRRLVSEIASKGGRAAHAAGTAHEFSGQEAREAGRKGGLAPHSPRRMRPSSPASDRKDA